MAKEILFHQLLEIGFTENEAKVYLAAVELKEALAGSISKRANVKRPATYVLLQRLQEKGLVDCFKKNEHLFFRVTPPRGFIEEEMQKMKKLSDSLKGLESGLPELLAEHSQYLLPSQVSIFKGKKGWAQMVEGASRASTEILSWTATSQWRQVLSVCSPALRKKIQKKRRRKVAAEFGSERMVYDDKLAILFLEDEIGILIQSKLIAEARRKDFFAKK